MRVARHVRGGDLVRLRDGRVVVVRAHVVAPVELLRCTTDAGLPVDVAPDALRWHPADRCWVEGAA